MNVRVGLRWKIMLITVLPLVTLVFATLWLVNRNVTRQAHVTLHDELRRASAVLENLLGVTEHSLVVTGEVIAQDPKFFSVLTIPGRHDDPQLRATVAGVARDFNAITQTDLFEVVDAGGRLLASVGRDASTVEGRERWVKDALSGRSRSGLLVQPGAHHLVFVVPAIAGGQVVGALLLGTRIGGDLADRLRQLTRSEVTFLSGETITGSTLESPGDRAAALAAIAPAATPGVYAPGGGVLEVRGPQHRYLTIVRPLPRSSSDQGQRYLVQRALDAETAFLRDMHTALIEVGVAAVMAALLAGFLIAERITAPVQRLVRGAEEMERGNFEYPLAIRTQDEIGVLASRFDDMRRGQREVIHRLQEVARLKSEFINVASHELRTPISVIRGYHELMLDGRLGGLTPPQQQAMEATLKSVETLTRIAEDATRVADIESERLVLRHAEHDVAGLLAEAAAAAAAHAAGRQVEVVREASDIGAVVVDGARLAQALAQLIGNGIRFTPDGGRVTVRAWRDGGDLVIEVRDTGVGIEPEKRTSLFGHASLVRDSLHHHSSSTLEFNSAGLGLGLPIARGIVEAHGGALTVDSTPGVGSTFSVRVPCHPAHGEAMAA